MSIFLASLPTLGALLGLLAIIAVLAIIIILLLAELNLFFTKVPQSTTVFINKGESMDVVWPNVGGYRMSHQEDPEGRRWLVPVTTSAQNKDAQEKERMDAFFYGALPGTRDFQQWLWKKFGVRFMGWAVLNTRRNTFNIRSRKRLQEGSDTDGGLKKRIVASHAEEGGTIVDNLMFLVPRPIFLEGVTLPGDNSKINLLLLVAFRQVIPVLPVYHLNGDFFTQLDAAVEAYITNFVSTYDQGKLTYQTWMALAKSGGEAELVKNVGKINADKKYYDDLAGSLGSDSEIVKYLDAVTHGQLTMTGAKDDDGIPSGIIPRFGFALVSFRLISWEPHDDTKPLAKAIQAKEINQREADGVVAQAEGRRQAKLKDAEGDAALFADPVRALLAVAPDKIDPNLAVDVLRTKIRTENLAGEKSKITTYIEGGASASVMVPTK